MVKPESDTRKLLMQLVAGDQAVPGGGAGFRGIGRRAFLLLEAQGTVVFDDMYIIKTIAKFDNLTMLGSVDCRMGHWYCQQIRATPQQSHISHT